MPCDTKLKPNQKISERAVEIREVVARLAAGLSVGKIKVKIGPQGGITFEGFTETERDGVTDNCAYRRLMASGSALALQTIQRAEMLAGRTVDRQAVARGVHAHGDGKGGLVWHNHKG